MWKLLVWSPRFHPESLDDRGSEFLEAARNRRISAGRRVQGQTTPTSRVPAPSTAKSGGSCEVGQVAHCINQATAAVPWTHAGDHLPFFGHTGQIKQPHLIRKVIARAGNAFRLTTIPSVPRNRGPGASSDVFVFACRRLIDFSSTRIVNNVEIHVVIVFG
ncbi:hypothetical protein GWI33_011548 [Rhynchophorus ferrugineus]|uniref:Uncharacterized protein n=1 Tax=Rhynchophorus ferrugineus TaxID=354439 RepID=A0A834MJZ5_RHYFE|nr:hypothetical protein GWI33_011548 [Rhynchophorus ferrugineus]